jgi:hypothetical protein
LYRKEASDERPRPDPAPEGAAGLEGRMSRLQNKLRAQKSIGFATLTGMIGSTLFTVAVVPSLFVVLQQIEARLTSPQAHPRRGGG